MKAFNTSLICASLFAVAGSAMGATITWDSPALIGDGSTTISVPAGYTVFAAESAGATEVVGSDSVTVNGILFDDDPLVSFSGGYSYGQAGYYSGGANANIETLLDSRYTSNGITVNVLLSDLTEGKDYQVALFVSDGNRTPDRSLTVGDGEGNISQSFDPEDSIYVTGSFTADASGNQNILVSGAGGAAAQYPHVNAVLVMEAVPEPSAVLLGGLGFLTLLRRQRSPSPALRAEL